MDLSSNGSRRIFGLPEVVLDFLIAFALNLIFVALIAVVLWPQGKTLLALRLAKGYALFWIITALTAVAVSQFQRFFRVDTDTHVDAYVISNLSHSVFLLAGWSAFATLAIHSVVVGMPTWPAVVLWIAGILSSFIAFVILTSFYRGPIYRVVNVAATLVSFFVFAVWPASGRAIFGWFFNLF